jgi:hypothetical protein
MTTVSPAKNDRRARGAGGVTGRLLPVVALGAFLAVAGDDEHRVVNADRRHQHGGRCAGGGRQPERAGQGEDRGHADPDHGGEQRQPGGGRRTERHQQHHGRDPVADRLRGAARRRLRRQCRTADLDGQPGGPGLVDGVLEMPLARVGQAVGLRGEGDGRVRRGAVSADGLRAEGIGGTGDLRAVGRREHDAGARAVGGGAGEAPLQQVERRLGLDAGHRGLGSGRRRGTGPDTGRHRHPQQDDEQTPPEDRSAQSTQEYGHETEVSPSIVDTSPGSRDGAVTSSCGCRRRRY